MELFHFRQQGDIHEPWLRLIIRRDTRRPNTEWPTFCTGSAMVLQAPQENDRSCGAKHSKCLRGAWQPVEVVPGGWEALKLCRFQETLLSLILDSD